jgi:D-alanyl-D-alanine carboxypeptidase/D-alanyl-D-alanine-endopeptidase (penicillin-binding protein 4)
VWALVLAACAACADEPPLQSLARTHLGAGQGVYVRAEDGTVLAAEAETHAVHPASVTKVATTLALLERLGPEHRFETGILADGPVRNGVLAGDLRIEAARDPFLVTESALQVLCRLRRLGLRAVDGRIVVSGPLLFNWQPDPDGRRLAATLAGRDGAGRWSAVAVRGECPATLGAAALAFHGRTSARLPGTTPLLVYRSPPLLHLVKVLNGYSNNVFHLVSPVIGGPAAVEAVARAHVPPALRDEVVITNAAGGGDENRLSPRVVVTLLDALAAWAGAHGRALSDVLPVSRVDPGTLRERPAGDPPLAGMIVGKTGTFGSVGASALAGVLRTRRYGRVTFAVLNHGVAVPDARRRQDAFVRALVAATDAEPWPYTLPTVPDFFAAELAPAS